MAKTKTQTVATETKSPSETPKKKSWDRIGQMKQSDDGSYRLTIDQDVTLKAGDVVFLRKPADEIASLVAKGFITQEVADERLARLPEFVKFNLIKPPPKDNGNF